MSEQFELARLATHGNGADKRRLGLASAFIGHPEQKAIFDDLLGLPPEVVPIGLALIGKPGVDPTAERGTSRMKERRKPIGELVHWEGW